jgi:hypothetical protein
LLAAHDWFAADWMALLEVLIKADPRTATELGRSTMHLLFFASPAIANSACQQWETDTLEGLAAQAHREFQTAMVFYAGLGRGFRAQPRRDVYPGGGGAPAGAARSATRRQSVGRNEPCPCRSGKKYKKCCGATH